jgi:hypothetical protein
VTARRCTVLLVLACLVPCSGFASVFELFGASPRAVGMGGAMSAAASGGEAAFHNPALLGGATIGDVWAGISFTRFSLDVEQARPVCTAGYLTCSGQHIAGFSSRATQLPRDSSAFEIGWAYPVGGIFRDRVVFGAGLALPGGHLIRISGADPQAPNFVQYEGMPDRIAFLFAGAWRITDWWWVGVGTQVLAVLNADIALDLNPTNHTMDNAAVRIGLAPRARLTAGTAVHPIDRLWLGVSYRQKLSLEYKIPTTIDLGSAADIAIDLGHETLFTPDTLHVGAAWKALDGRLLVTGDLGLSLWSQAPDPSPYVRLQVSGPAVDALGLGGALQVGVDSPAVRLQFADTWTPSLGAEWSVGDVRLRGGLQYRPSPAPRATGPFNYLDNDAVAISAGVGYRFGSHPADVKARMLRMDDPAGPPAPLHLDLAVQTLNLARRTIQKADAQDPVGDLSHGGTVWHVAMSFGASF